MNPHTVLFLDYSAPDGPEPLQWEPEGIPNSAGINDVVRLLTQFRAFVRRKRAELKREVSTLAAVNDENVRHLLRFAYRASFQTDEGRPIRARVAVPREEKWWEDSAVELGPEDVAMIVARTSLGTVLSRLGTWVEDARHHAYRFREPRRLEDHKLLVKLAPLIPERDGIIAVRETDGGLCVTGLGLLDQDDADGALLHMPGLWQPSGGLLIELLGAGHIRVVEGKATFVLAADRLVTRRMALHVPLVEQWLVELSRAWVAEFRTNPAFSPDVPHFQPFEGTDSDELFPRLDVQVAVMRMLRSAVSLGHGGAFAILPDVNAAPLTLTYPVNPVDLGAELRQTWRAHCEVWRSGRDANADHAGVAEAKRVAANRWLSRLASVGQLSAADGCVVFDRRLVLHGFGGSIDKNLSGVDLGTCHDLTTEKDLPAEELLKSFGERHKSAFALCRKIPNAIVFVISQDGDLRLFSSDADGRVCFASNLSA
ncbi:MAG: hypothetical protein C0467_17625 [Planctomycetaceae bacterium]|nr:hypothetical protein [Planctomycetaceae bacterium]